MKAFVLSGDAGSQKLIIQANIPFLELYKRARFTYMEDPTNDPYDETDNVPVNEFYQRRVDEERVKNIKKFIRESILKERGNKRVSVLFPTAMLIAVQTTSELTLEVGKEYEFDAVINDDDLFYIVDGQHRLYSMKSLYEELQVWDMFGQEDDSYVMEYLKKYVFNCTILLNFDLWEQAQVFADVNFNQKKVSASLYYTIYGMNYSTDQSDLNRNYIYLAHQLVKVLNKHEASPLKGFIKMLGSGSGFISQAFIADALMRNIKSPKGIWFVDPYNMKIPPVYRYMTIEVLSFFSAVKEAFPEYWPEGNDPKSIICKTTGVGALLRLMAYLHQEKIPSALFDEMKKMERSQVHKEYKSMVYDMLMLLDAYKKRLFALKGEYAGTGGKGLEVKLYREMRHIIAHPDLKLYEERNLIVNNRQVGVKIYTTEHGLFIFEMSSYFRNGDQSQYLLDIESRMSTTLDGLNKKIDIYLSRIEPNSQVYTNKDY